MYLNKAAKLLTTSSIGEAAGAFGTTDALTAYRHCTVRAHRPLIINRVVFGIEPHPRIFVYLVPGGYKGSMYDVRILYRSGLKKLAACCPFKRYWCMQCRKTTPQSERRTE